jgi:hypothetical protein
MRNAVGDAAETSQAIFYDPAHYATPSGDGIIVLQYHTVNNVDGTDGYCTVGIQNAMQDDGLLYSYFNVLSPGAASLAAGRAIKFVPATAQPQGVLAGTVRNSSTGQTPLAGASVHLLGTDRTYSSGADGSYAGSAPGGIYDVTCSRAGFEPDTAFGVVIVPPQTTVVDFSLLDVGGPQISGVTRLLSTTDPIGPYAIDATVSDPSGLGPVTLHYRANGAGWVALPMTLAGGAYHAAIPGLPTGTRADYYVEAEDALGHVSVEPAGAPAEFYTFYITQVSYATEAEDPGPDGWQLGVAGDGASSGLWIRDDPVGTVYNGLEMQPEDDHTAPPGTKCFVTGNGSAGGAAGDADVDGGCTTQQSPVFDLSLAEAALVRYWRWYGEGGNSTDDDWVAYVSSDGGSNWVELEREAEHSGGWEAVAVDLTEKITLTGSVVFRFQACDENTAGLVEAAIDDFSLEVYIPNPDAVPGLDRPAVFALERGRPNPFAGATAVRFALARAGTARLVLYDVQGRAVRTLWNGPAAAGPHELVWDGRNDRGAPLPSGVYFARLQADGRHAEAKLLKLE